MSRLPAGLAHSVDRESELPVGVQLARRLRAAVAEGSLTPGERAPSIRSLAEAAGVNPNTVRAVYQRLEDEGVLRSEQGRGTFVLDPPSQDRITRRELQREVARLEAELVGRPPLVPRLGRASSSQAGRLLTTRELADVRDDLLARLEKLDADRADVLRRLSEIDSPPADAVPPRRSNYSLANARVRWRAG